VNVFYLSTMAMGAASRHLEGAQERAFFANRVTPKSTPPASPGGRLPVETDADVRVAAQRRPCWVPKKKEDCNKPPGDIPEEDRDYYLERKYPSFGNLAPRDIASRRRRSSATTARRRPGGRGVYLDFKDAIQRLGEDTIRERYGNLFEMYERITDENATRSRCGSTRPPLCHGGLWVDYNLMSTIPASSSWGGELLVHGRTGWGLP